MSRLRRLLALGGLTLSGLGGSTFAYYRYNLLGQPQQEQQHFHSAAECSPDESRRSWDDDWDLRDPTTAPRSATSTSKATNSNSTNSSSSSSSSRSRRARRSPHVCKDAAATTTSTATRTTEIPILDPFSETVTSCPVSTCPVSRDPGIPCATRHVLLVRHGQYVYNEDDSFRVLTDLGRQQATLTGERLKALGLKLNSMVVSTMTRAQETANLIAQKLPDVTTSHCSLLREGTPYPIEPKSSVWTPLDKTFSKDNPRIEGAFRKYIHRAGPKQTEDSYDLLVCHANVIRYFVCRSLQFPPEGWGRMKIAHCGLTWLTIGPKGRVSMRGLGDIGHLPPDLITYS